MTFTPIPPTTPGFYAWRANDEDKDVELCNVVVGGMEELIALFAGSDKEWTIQLAGGQWCRLVPKDEIQKAWIESYDDVIGIKGTALPTERWLKSRAKRVMEGLE